MKIFKQKKFYVIVLLLVGGAYLGYSKFFAKPATVYTTSKIELGTLKQTVTETGTIKRALDANLNFSGQGRIATQTVAIGAKVKQGQLLAELDYSNLKIQARQAQANLEVAKANQQKVLRGATSQDINLSQTSIAQAQSALDNAKKNYTKTLAAAEATIAQAEKNYNDLAGSSSKVPTIAAVNSAKSSLAKNKIAYQKIIDNSVATLLVAIHDKNAVALTAVDAVNRVLTDENAKDSLGVQDISSLSAAKSNYTVVTALGGPAAAAYETAAATNNIEDIKSAYTLVDAFLTQAVALANQTFVVLTKTVVSSKLSQTQLDTFKSSISGQITLSNAGLSVLEQNKQAFDNAQTNYDTVISSSEQSLNAAEASLASAQLSAQNSLTNARLNKTRDLQAAQAQIDAAAQALKLAQAQYGKTTATARPEDIALMAAQVKQAQANLDAVNNQITNSQIRAPFAGEITQVNYQVGETPTAAQPVMVILGHDQYEVQVDIAESDVAKVALGNPAELDFDAFGQGVKFFATLDQLDPAQTVIQEVVYYKGKVGHLVATSTSASYLKQIKPGMTANVTIMANRREGVLIMPFRAIIDRNGQRTVDLLVDGQPKTVPVTIGLRGDDGLVEVISGVAAGDEVILSKTP